MNLKTWFVYFGILQTISMVASLYQALATQQVIGLISANPLHFGLFTFFASLLSMTGYIVCGFLVDEKGLIKILILAQVALFIFNIFLL